MTNESCSYCEEPYGQTIPLLAVPEDRFQLFIHNTEDDKKDNGAGLVLLRRGFNAGYTNISFCPVCGRFLNEGC